MAPKPLHRRDAESAEGDSISLCMETQDLARRYQDKTNEELLRLASDPEELTPEAQLQLHAELAKRGIDPEASLEEFWAEEGQSATQPTKQRMKGYGFAATLRDWKGYRKQTGEWPVVSVIASVVQGVVLLSCVLFIVLFAVKHDWSRTKFLLVCASVLLAELCLWDRLQKKIRLKELREYRRRRSLRVTEPK
jgi:hypothetical protein